MNTQKQTTVCTLNFSGKLGNLKHLTSKPSLLKVFGSFCSLVNLWESCGKLRETCSIAGKRSVILFFFILVTGFCKAQNLVVNPSFEDYTSCPTSVGDIYKAVGWDAFNNSPDYFHSCSFNVPNNGYGYQFAAQGNAYAGLITYWEGGLYREIIGDSLSIPLVPFQKYYLSFKVNCADASPVGYNTNNIGAKFSTVKTSAVNINNIATINYSLLINDTLNWLRVSGSFTADSAYKYLLIGNFFDDLNTTVTNPSTGIYAYYFIDEVCLATDSMFCANYTTSINELNDSKSISLFPNPADNVISIHANSDSAISIYDSLGRNVFYRAEGSAIVTVNTEDWSNGIYFVNISNITHKLIIHH